MHEFSCIYYILVCQNFLNSLFQQFHHLKQSKTSPNTRPIFTNYAKKFTQQCPHNQFCLPSHLLPFSGLSVVRVSPQRCAFVAILLEMKSLVILLFLIGLSDAVGLAKGLYCGVEICYDGKYLNLVN